MANTATLNATPAQRVVRSAARIERLKQAIQKARQRNQGERLISLRAELERRQEELNTLRAAIDAALR